MVELLVFVVPFAALVGAVALRLVWPRVLTAAVLGAVLLLGALDLLAWAAIATDFRDADGFIDCWPDCTFLQNAVLAAVFWVPLVMTALVVLAVAYVAVTSRRGTRPAG